MKRSVKRNLIAVFSMLAVGALTATGVNAISANALELTDTANNFYVVDGASVLYKAAEGEEKAQAGIRFQAVMTEEYYAVATGTAVTYGIELYSALNDTHLTTVDCTENITLSAKGYKQNGEALGKNAYVFNASVNYGELTGDSARLAYAFDMYAKAYVEIDGTKTYAASNQTVRSMSEVAKNAYNDNASEYYENETLGAYFQNLTEATETAIVASLPDEADDKQVTIAGLKDDQGTKKAYVGGTELTEVTFDGDNVVLSDTDAAKVKVAQNYALTVLSDSGKTYAGTFSGITKYIDDTDFITVLRNETVNVAGNYFMLDGDVNLTEADFAVQVAGTYFAVRNMRSTFDGNGYAVSVKANTNAKAMTLFRDIWDTCVVKNVNLNFNAKMQVNAMSAILGTYVTAGGTVENCYIEANVVPVTASGVLVENADVSALYQIANKDTSTTINEIVVNMNVVAGTGYLSVRPIGNVVIKKVAMIGTDETPVLTPNTQAVIYEDTSYYYTSVEDFIAGTNGMRVTYKTAKVDAVWDTATGVAYEKWDNVWSISEGKIELLGTQTNVALPDRTVTASVTGSTLTTTDTDTILNAYEVYAGETLLNTFVGSCDVSPSALEKAGVIKAGENEIALTVKTAIGKDTVATVDGTLKVFGMDQTNFVTTVRTAQADVKTDYYYIMCGDVTLGVEDYSTAQKLDSSFLVTANLYVPIDGNGHTLSVKGDLTSNVYNSVFGSVYSKIQNLVYEYEVTRGNGGANQTAFFALFIQNTGSVNNCYLTANVTFATSAGALFTDTNFASMYIAMIFQTAGTTAEKSLQNVIIDINVTNECAMTLSAVGRSANNRVMSNVVLLGGDNATKKLFGSYGTNAVLHNAQINACYYYADFANFINGTNGQTTGSGTTTVPNTTWTATTAKAYTSWSNVWTIDETGIKLCGTTVYTVPTQA